MKKFILISLIILLVFGCTKVVEEKKPIKIALNQWPGYAVAFIAKEKGFFEKNNVKVELVFDKEYSKSQERYKNSEVDGVFEVFTDTIFHNSEGIKTKVVYVVGGLVSLAAGGYLLKDSITERTVTAFVGTAAAGAANTGVRSGCAACDACTAT